MDFFDKAAKKAKEVGSNVALTAASVGNAIGNVTKEQSELASLKIQKSAIDKKLDRLYAEIGRKYIDYTEACEVEDKFDVSDILENMKTKLEKISEINKQIESLESQIKQNNIEKELQKAQEQFDLEKKKLDKAMDMDVVTEAEYQEKLQKAQKKFDNYDMIRKIDMQYEMNIISKSEYDEKIANILS